MKLPMRSRDKSDVKARRSFMSGSTERFHRFLPILRKFTTNASLSGAPSSNSSSGGRVTRHEDVFVGSFTDYKTLAEFEELIEIKLRKIVERRCPQLPERDDERDLDAGNLDCGVTVSWAWNPSSSSTRRSSSDGLAPSGPTLESLRKTQIDKDDPRGFLLMLGASGSGKSSLARAGVMPTLVEPGVIDGIGLWRRAVMKPSDAEGHVFLGLAQAVLYEGGLPELAAHGSTAEALAIGSTKGERKP